MSIRIIPEEEIKQAAGSFHNPPLLFSNPKNLYQHRAKRLRELAKAHPLADYLLFVADIVDSQARILQQHPIPQDPRLAKNNLSQPLLAEHPLSAQTWSRHPVWRELLTILLTDMKDKANEQSLQTIEWLEKTSDSELERLADKLLRQDFSQISSDKAVFIWAALSLYWLQLTQQIPHRSIAESSDNLHVCPVCASAPTASVIHLGSTQGLRYLHCSLCESEWNVVRAKCTNCDQSQHIDYWSIDNEFAVVRSESCGDCHSYLKIMYQDKDPHVEAIADDLANLFLDMEMEEKGFARSGLNPFMFPNEEG